MADLPTNDSFRDLMTRLRGGDEAAATRLFHQYRQRLIALARGRLDAAVRRKTDPEDVVQSVYKSFFRRQAKGEVEVDGWDNLWTLLALITVRKCVNYGKHYRRERRNIDRETSVDEADRSWEVLSREPTPEAAAGLTDLMEQVLRDLTPRERDVVTLTLQGHTAVEAGAQAGCAERTVRRVLAHVRQRLERLHAQSAVAP